MHSRISTLMRFMTKSSVTQIARHLNFLLTFNILRYDRLHRAHEEL
jgi:hypothetical protein